MILFDNIISAAESLSDNPHDLFNFSTPNKQSITVYEDEYVIVSLTLSKLAHNRHIYSTIKFTKYKTIEKDSSLQLKIDPEKTIKENLEDVSILSMVSSSLNTCNINGLDEVNFIKNGYSLEVVKTSNRYVTIAEYINAVPFEKRFDSLEKLFNYINYRQMFHSNINIGLNVSDPELSNIKRNIKVLKSNAEGVLTTMLSKIISKNTAIEINIDDISFTNIRRTQGNTFFDLTYTKECGDEYTKSCVYNKIIGATTSLGVDDISSTEIHDLHIILFILNQIEVSYSGHFDKYVSLVLQHSKFKSKVTSIDTKRIKQKDMNSIKDKISKALVDAKGKEEMLSDQITITSFNGYRRYVVLNGVMKNRKRCTLLVYATKNGTIFEEYQLPVEKNRIHEEARDFLTQYFI